MADAEDDVAAVDWLINNVQSSEHDHRSVLPTAASKDLTASVDRPKPINGRTTFEDLPGELRNKIYDLSGCLRYWEPQKVTSFRSTLKGDVHPKSIHHDGCVTRALHDRSTKLRAAYLVINGKDIATDFCGHHLVHSFSRFSEVLGYSIKCHGASVAPPSLTRVSEFTREETLSIFYADHSFVAKLDGDGRQLLHWLDTIGPINAGLLRRLYLVYSKKQTLKYIDKELRRELQHRGLNVDPKAGVLKLVRMQFPFRYDEISILVELDRLRALERKAQA